MGLKQNDSDKAKLDNLAREGYGPTIIMFVAIGLALFFLSFF